ncbi:MAG TPA: AmmeMemoRadiSam system radical SAM enzyme [Chitinivibrionales bacterium]|nr:AmmeMemoRadiSam system radical SAM enzyme [Chitinivibrionales bacterium]
MITRREMLKSSAACLAGMCSASVCFAKTAPQRKTALYWSAMGDNAVACELCPHQCILQDGKTGLCRTRENVKGTLVNNGYANPCAIHVDPVEKKPVYHFLPGTKAYSLAIAGCNLRCLNCQNYTISQQFPKDTENMYLPPEKVIEEAKREQCSSIAYTYSEPIVWYEYVLETSKLAKKAGLKNILVTAGYINEAPLKELSEFMDAATIDLKGFKNETYLKLNSAKLGPILDAIANAVKFGIWVEVSNLVVPTWTDDYDTIRKMCAWHKQNLGAEVPLHFLRFFPLYKLENLFPTPTDSLQKAQKIARDEGVRYVYVGNVAEIDSNTYCPSCKKAVVEREGYTIKKNAIKGGKCSYCGAVIKGIWA